MKSWQKPALKLAAGLLAALLCLLFVVIADNRRAEWELRGGGRKFALEGSDYVTADPTMVPQRFPAVKAKGNYRVFLVGGSVIMGSPYVNQSSRVLNLFLGLLTLPPTGGISTWLEEYLAALYPDRKIQVVNAAAGARDSGDAFQVFKEIVEKGSPDLVLLMENKAPGVADGPRLEDDAARRARARAYERVLGEFAALAESRGVTTYFMTMPQNLADWLPSDTDDFQAFEIMAMIDARDFTGALEQLKKGDGGGNALRAYLTGRCYHRLGKLELAKKYYRLASELDRASWRIRPSQNRILAARARGPHVRLIDLDAVVAGLAADGIPGHEQFLDDSHLRLSVNQAAALAIANRLARDDPSAAGRASLLDRVRLRPLNAKGLRTLYLIKAAHWLRMGLFSGLDLGEKRNRRAVADGYLSAYQLINEQIRLAKDEKKRPK